jgi:hypothetical protein
MWVADEPSHQLDGPGQWRIGVQDGQPGVITQYLSPGQTEVAGRGLADLLGRDLARDVLAWFNEALAAWKPGQEDAEQWARMNDPSAYNELIIHLAARVDPVGARCRPNRHRELVLSALAQAWGRPLNGQRAWYLANGPDEADETWDDYGAEAMAFYDLAELHKPTVAVYVPAA